MYMDNGLILAVNAALSIGEHFPLCRENYI